MQTRYLRILLVLVLAFCAITSFGGGVGLITTNGLGMTVESLNGVFSSFLFPGLILFFIVGGSSLFAAISGLQNKSYAMWAAMVAGFGMQIWIYVELCIILSLHWLHSFYFAIGTLTLILTFLVHKNNKEEKSLQR